MRNDFDHHSKGQTQVNVNFIKITLLDSRKTHKISLSRF